MRSLVLTVVLIGGCAATTSPTRTAMAHDDIAAPWHEAIAPQRASREHDPFSRYVRSNIVRAGSRLDGEVLPEIVDPVSARYAEMDHVVRRILPLTLEQLDVDELVAHADSLRNLEPIEDRRSWAAADTMVLEVQEAVWAYVDDERFDESIGSMTKPATRRELAAAALRNVQITLSFHAPEPSPHSGWYCVLGYVPEVILRGPTRVPMLALAAGADPEEVADEVAATIRGIHEAGGAD